MTDERRAEDVREEGYRVVLRLADEMGCVVGGDWTTVAINAYLQGRVDGLAWVQNMDILKATP